MTISQEREALEGLAEELEGLLAAATGRPWSVSQGGATIRAVKKYVHADGSLSDLSTRICYGYDGNTDQRAIDYALIVRTINALPALLAAARASLEPNP